MTIDASRPTNSALRMWQGPCRAARGPLRGGPHTLAALAAIPPHQLELMQQVAADSSCHLSWTVLAAIADTESGFGSNMATSSASAIGYGQFLPATWAGAQRRDGRQKDVVRSHSMAHKDAHQTT